MFLSCFYADVCVRVFTHTMDWSANDWSNRLFCFLFISVNVFSFMFCSLYSLTFRLNFFRIPCGLPLQISRLLFWLWKSFFYVLFRAFPLFWRQFTSDLFWLHILRAEYKCFAYIEFHLKLYIQSHCLPTVFLMFFFVYHYLFCCFRGLFACFRSIFCLVK